MPVELTVTLFAAAASLAGGFFGSRFARTNEQIRHRRERVAIAYAEYLKCVGEMAASNNADAIKAEASGRLITAKARLCVDGSPEVVKALSELESLAGKGTGKIRAAMFTLVSAMRRDLEAPGGVTEEQVSEILFGPPAA